MDKIHGKLITKADKIAVIMGCVLVVYGFSFVMMASVVLYRAINPERTRKEIEETKELL